MSKYILLCDYCSWKTISDLDSLKSQEIKNDTLSCKKFRCPKCGRAVSAKKIKDPQKDLEKQKEELRVQEENKKWMDESIAFQINFNKERNEDDNGDDH